MADERQASLICGFSFKPPPASKAVKKQNPQVVRKPYGPSKRSTHLTPMSNQDKQTGIKVSLDPTRLQKRTGRIKKINTTVSIQQPGKQEKESKDIKINCPDVAGKAPYEEKPAGIPMQQVVKKGNSFKDVVEKIQDESTFEGMLSDAIRCAIGGEPSKLTAAKIVHFMKRKCIPKRGKPDAGNKSKAATDVKVISTNSGRDNFAKAEVLQSTNNKHLRVDSNKRESNEREVRAVIQKTKPQQKEASISTVIKRNDNKKPVVQQPLNEQAKSSVIQRQDNIKSSGRKDESVVMKKTKPQQKETSNSMVVKRNDNKNPVAQQPLKEQLKSSTIEREDNLKLNRHKDRNLVMKKTKPQQKETGVKRNDDKPVAQQPLKEQHKSSTLRSEDETVVMKKTKPQQKETGVKRNDDKAVAQQPLKEQPKSDTVRREDETVVMKKTEPQQKETGVKRNDDKAVAQQPVKEQPKSSTVRSEDETVVMKKTKPQQKETSISTSVKQSNDKKLLVRESLKEQSKSSTIHREDNSKTKLHKDENHNELDADGATSQGIKSKAEGNSQPNKAGGSKTRKPVVRWKRGPFAKQKPCHPNNAEPPVSKMEPVGDQMVANPEVKADATAEKSVQPSMLVKILASKGITKDAQKVPSIMRPVDVDCHEKSPRKVCHPKSRILGSKLSPVAASAKSTQTSTNKCHTRDLSSSAPSSGKKQGVPRKMPEMKTNLSTLQTRSSQFKNSRKFSQKKPTSEPDVGKSIAKDATTKTTASDVVQEEKPTEIGDSILAGRLLDGTNYSHGLPQEVIDSLHSPYEILVYYKDLEEINKDVEDSQNNLPKLEEMSNVLESLQFRVTWIQRRVMAHTRTLKAQKNRADKSKLADKV